MKVIVYAQDLSGRNDDGYYSKPNLSLALDLFFGAGDAANFIDPDGQDPLTRSDAEELFEQEAKITFYNENGEKVVIAKDQDRDSP